MDVNRPCIPKVFPQTMYTCGRPCLCMFCVKKNLIGVKWCTLVATFEKSRPDFPNVSPLPSAAPLKRRCSMRKLFVHPVNAPKLEDRKRNHPKPTLPRPQTLQPLYTPGDDPASESAGTSARPGAAQPQACLGFAGFRV